MPPPRRTDRHSDLPRWPRRAASKIFASKSSTIAAAVIAATILAITSVIGWYLFGSANKGAHPLATGVESIPVVGDHAIASDFSARTRPNAVGESQDGLPWNDDMARELSQLKSDVNQLEAEVHQLETKLGPATEPDSSVRQKREFNSTKTIRPSIKEK